MYGHGIRKNHYTYLQATLPDRRKLKSIEQDPDLTPEGRHAKAAPIRDRLRERFDAVAAKSRTLVDDARAEYLLRLPAAAQEAAAFKSPERTLAVRQLAEGEGLAGLSRLAELAAQARDLPAAHAIRRAAAALPGEERRQLAPRLDAIGADGTESSLADLVAAQYAYSLYKLAGPEADADANIFQNPAATVEAHRTAASVPTGTEGEMRLLPEPEVDRLLKLVGLPRERPSDPVTESTQPVATE